MERKTLIIVVLVILGVGLWGFYINKYILPKINNKLDNDNPFDSTKTSLLISSSSNIISAINNAVMTQISMGELDVPNHFDNIKNVMGIEIGFRGEMPVCIDLYLGDDYKIERGIIEFKGYVVPIRNSIIDRYNIKSVNDKTVVKCSKK